MLRSLTADNSIKFAKGLSPEQIRRMLECEPAALKRLEPGGDLEGVDGTKVPDELLYKPNEGVLPQPKTEEELAAERKELQELKEAYETKDAAQFHEYILGRGYQP